MLLIKFKTSSSIKTFTWLLVYFLAFSANSAEQNSTVKIGTPVSGGSSFSNLLRRCKDKDNPCFWDRAGVAVQSKINKYIFQVAHVVTATRAFAGPNQYPPEGFGAYGILAFKSKASEYDMGRHKMICEAYINSIPHKDMSNLPTINQMVTVWPVETDEIADVINKVKGSEVCKLAIENYNLSYGLLAIKNAEEAGVNLDGIGPFLLAWAPPKEFGDSEAVVLYSDFSLSFKYEQALPAMQRWVKDIESDPELWRDGWSIEKIKLTFQRWFDDYGPSIAGSFGIKI